MTRKFQKYGKTLQSALLILLCALLCAAVFVACGDPNENAGGGGEDPPAETKREAPIVRIVTDSGEDIPGKQAESDPTPAYMGCKVTVEGLSENESFADATAQIRVRGNNTACYPKLPYRIKFDRKRNMCGLNDGAQCKNWVLLASWKDTSMLRDLTALHLAEKILGADGYYCSDATYVEVYVNNDYRGLYILAEQQQVNPNRVNLPEVANGYTGTDIGYFFEYDGYAFKEPSGEWFAMDYGNTPLDCTNGGSRTPFMTQARYAIKNDLYSTDQRDFLKTYLEGVWKILYNAAYNGQAWEFVDSSMQTVGLSNLTPREAVEQAVDLRSFVDMYLLSDFVCDNDIDWSSFFLSADMSPTGNKKLTLQAPWDFDSAFNLMRTSVAYDVVHKPFASDNLTVLGKQLLLSPLPWTAVLAHTDWFKNLVAERWIELYDDGVFADLSAFVSEQTTKYASYYARNYERWLESMGGFDDPELADIVKEFRTQADASAYLSKFIGDRIAYLNELYRTQYAL